MCEIFRKHNNDPQLALTMNPNPPPQEPRFLKLDEICDQFEQAWQSSTAPVISQFLAEHRDQWGNWDQTTRSQLLEELIKLDLEFRWRQQQETGDLTQVRTEQDTHITAGDESKRWFL